MTHECIRLFDEYGNTVLLHTTHTGMHMLEWIKAAPGVVASTRPYLRTSQDAKGAIERDGKLTEWFDHIYCVMSLLITAQPCALCYVPENDIADLATWSGADDPWILRITTVTDKVVWEITPPKEAKQTPITIVPAELFCAVCEKLHGLPLQYRTAYDGLREYYDRILSVHRGEIDDEVAEEYKAKRLPREGQDDYIWFRDAIERHAIRLQGETDGEDADDAID